MNHDERALWVVVAIAVVVVAAAAAAADADADAGGARIHEHYSGIPIWIE